MHEYIHFFMPNVNIPSIIIIVFTIKLLLSIGIFRYLFISKLILLTPPDENPNR